MASKLYLTYAAGLLCALQAQAFPFVGLEGPASPSSVRVKRQSPSAYPPFDAAQQYVSNTGIHAFVPPGNDDFRGPCPGLNTLANHNYIPHIGLATIADFVTGTYQVFGMAADLATVLAVYGAVFDGQAVSWAIGGEPHIGIGGSHNNYETDSSPVRADLYQYGSNTEIVMEQFYELYNMQPDAATANYTLDVLKEFRAVRYNESIAKNPYFYYAPFSGAVVSQAAYAFIFRFMANKSEEYPTGTLNKDVLKSFMSITGPEDKLTWVPGHERIPDNFYRRNNADLYTLDYFQQDSNELVKGQEYVQQAGCNQGTVDSFTPVDPTDLTGGAVGPAAALADPLCYGLAFAYRQTQQIPALGGLVAEVAEELLLPIQNSLGCVTIPKLNETTLQACPGYSLYGGPTAAVAPGAVQH